MIMKWNARFKKVNRVLGKWMEGGTSWTRVESSWRSSTRSVSLSKALLCCCKSLESTTISTPSSPPSISLSLRNHLFALSSFQILCSVLLCPSKLKNPKGDASPTLCPLRVFLLYSVCFNNNNKKKQLI